MDTTSLQSGITFDDGHLMTQIKFWRIAGAALPPYMWSLKARIVLCMQGNEIQIPPDWMTNPKKSPNVEFARLEWRPV
jgi:hypothetical protein